MWIKLLAGAGDWGELKLMQVGKGIFLPDLESSHFKEQNPSILISAGKNFPAYLVLLWVQPLLDSFGVTLCHGVNDGQDEEVTHHYNNQLLKHPGQPVFSLQEERQNNPKCFISLAVNRESSTCFSK